MKNSWGGIVLILLGVMFLLDSMGVMEFNHIIRKFWPVVLILIGINILFKKQK
jgi:ABC-type microcin C transport system permease subunit YejB